MLAEDLVLVFAIFNTHSTPFLWTSLQTPAAKQQRKYMLKGYFVLEAWGFSLLPSCQHSTWLILRDPSEPQESSILFVSKADKGRRERGPARPEDIDLAKWKNLKVAEGKCEARRDLRKTSFLPSCLCDSEPGETRSLEELKCHLMLSINCQPEFLRIAKGHLPPCQRLWCGWVTLSLEEGEEGPTRWSDMCSESRIREVLSSLVSEEKEVEKVFGSLH